MHASSRLVLPLALAMSATLAAAPARAQEAALTPVSTAAPLAQSTPAAPAAADAAPAGPTMDAAAVGVRHSAPATNDATTQRRGGYGQPMALMIVGGAAVLVGLIIGGGAGTAIAIGGAVAGLVGLYQYLQ